jgi:hypothetical protein
MPWRSEHFFAALLALCIYVAQNAAAPPLIPCGDRPGYYVGFGSSRCYKYVRTPSSFYVANKACSDDNAYLAALSSKAESDWYGSVVVADTWTGNYATMRVRKTCRIDARVVAGGLLVQPPPTACSSTRHVREERVTIKDVNGRAC